MGAGGMRGPGAAMSAAQNPMQKQGGPMQPSQLNLPPGIQQAIAAQQMQQNPMQQIGAGGPINPAMYKQSFMQQQQGGPMQQMPPQGAAGGKGGMPGAGPAPNAMQQFSQQQGLAGLMQPQQSSTNSLQ